MAHSIEIWTMVGEKGTLYCPACLSCGWCGGDGSRQEADEEAQLHREGKRRPWQAEPGTLKPWSPSEHPTKSG